MRKTLIDNADVGKETFDQIADTISSEFKELLQEYKTNKGKHLLHGLFCMVSEQQIFTTHISKNGHEFADVKREKKILAGFYAKLKETLGADKFDEAYDQWNKWRVNNE